MENSHSSNSPAQYFPEKNSPVENSLVFFAQIIFDEKMFLLLGAIQNDVNKVGGGGWRWGYPKLVTKSDVGRREVHTNSDINTKKKYV